MNFHSIFCFYRAESKQQDKMNKNWVFKLLFFQIGLYLAKIFEVKNCLELYQLLYVAIVFAKESNFLNYIVRIRRNLLPTAKKNHFKTQKFEYKKLGLKMIYKNQWT